MDKQFQLAIAGFLFGCLFVMTAWITDIVTNGLVFTPVAILQIHNENLLHYIIDTAPFVLGFFGFFIGSAFQRTDTFVIQDEASSKYNSLLLNSAGVAIFGVDLDGKCTFANVACFEALGFKTEMSLLGRNIHSLIHHSRKDGSTYSSEECKILQSCKKKQGCHVDDEVFWREAGDSFPVEYWSSPIYNEGELLGSVVSFVDISERSSA